MSQKKVVEYKAEKRNRKETLKKQKRINVIKSIVAIAVVVIIIGTVGFAIYSKSNVAGGTDANTVDISSINNYIDSLNLNEAMVADDEEVEEKEAENDAKDTTSDAASVEDSK